MSTITDWHLSEMEEFTKHNPNTSDVPERVIIKGLTIIKIKSRELTLEELNEIDTDSLFVKWGHK